MIRKYKILQLSTIILIILAPHHKCLAKDDPIYVPSEIRLSTYKSRNILGLGKIPPFTVTKPLWNSTAERNKEDQQINLWILSQNQLWLWALPQNSLGKITITNPVHPLAKDLHPSTENSLISSNANTLYIYQNQTFLIYKIVEKKLLKIDFPKTHYGTIKSFLPEGKDLWIITEKGSLYYDSDTGKLSPQNRLDLSDYSGLGVINQNSSMLYPTKNKVMSVPLKTTPKDSTTPQKAVFFKTNHPILGLEKTAQELFIHTAYSIIRLDVSGKLIQAIPVEQQRHLHRISFESFNHSYLFTDGLVEVYSTKRKQVIRYTVPPPVKNTSSPFLLASPYLVLGSGSGGMLRVFDTRRTSELSLEQNHD